MLLLAVGERAHRQCDWPGTFRMEGLRAMLFSKSCHAVLMCIHPSCRRNDAGAGKRREASPCAPRYSSVSKTISLPWAPINRCDEAQSGRCDLIVAQQEHQESD